MNKRLQDIIVESKFALPVVAVHSLVVWIVAGLFTDSLYVQLLLMAATTYLMVILNTTNSLLRVYSRMVSCTFLLTVCMSQFLLPNINAHVLMMSLTSFLIILARAYQDAHAPGITFYAFACVGVASLMEPHVLLLTPLVIVVMARNMMAMSARMLSASVLGLIAPYWIGTGVRLLFGRSVSSIFSSLGGLFTDMGFSSWTYMESDRIVPLMFMVLCSVLSLAHFIKYSYQDKIKTRMLLQLMFMLEGLSFLLLLVCPLHFDTLFAMMLVFGVPVVAHFLGTSRGLFSNIGFVIIMIVALLITWL